MVLLSKVGYRNRPVQYYEILFTGFFKKNISYFLESRSNNSEINISDTKLTLYPQTRTCFNDWQTLVPRFIEFAPRDIDSDDKEYGWLWVYFSLSSPDYPFNFKDFLQESLRGMGFVSTSAIAETRSRNYVDSYSKWPLSGLKEELEGELFPDNSMLTKKFPKPRRSPVNIDSNYNNRA